MTDNTINNDMTMGGAAATLLAGRYRIVRQLGQGGMGSVWLAEDTKLDGFKVAIKMLPSVLVNNKRAYAQVKSEALVSLKLSHPNIVTVRAFEEEGGSPFLVMDYIDGQTLDDYLAEKGKLTEEETVKLLKPVAAALDYAHTQGVVHRDVKPGNVMIRKDGTPFVLDFGIAREIQETMTRVTGKLSSGTLLYMSPEQLNGDAPKPAQDIYSFAAMAYECLKGEPPFSRGGIEDQIKHKTPESLSGDITIGHGVMNGLEKDASRRPKTCVEVVEMKIERPASGPRQIRQLADATIVIPEKDVRFLPPEERGAFGLDVCDKDHAPVKLVTASNAMIDRASVCADSVPVKFSGGPMRRVKVFALFVVLILLLGLWSVIIWGPAIKRFLLDTDKELFADTAITFLVDTSGSMDALDLTPKGEVFTHETTRLELVKKGLLKFIDDHPQAHVGLASFASVAQSVCDVGCADIRSAVRRLTIPSGSDSQRTAMGDGINGALAMLNDCQKRRRIVLLISDGVSNAGIVSVESAANRAIDAGVCVCAIGIGTQSKRTPIFAKDMLGREAVCHADSSYDVKQLKAVAESTGGVCFEVNSSKELEQAFESFVQLITQMPLSKPQQMNEQGSVQGDSAKRTAQTGVNHFGVSTNKGLFAAMEEQMDRMRNQMGCYANAGGRIENISGWATMEPMELRVGDRGSVVCHFCYPTNVTVGEVKIEGLPSIGLSYGTAENLPDLTEYRRCEFQGNKEGCRVKRIGIPIVCKEAIKTNVVITINGMASMKKGPHMTMTNSFKIEFPPFQILVNENDVSKSAR